MSAAAADPRVVVVDRPLRSIGELGERTIALDGAVAVPGLDPTGQRYSFDHHAGCLRLITSATCRQVWDALLLGLDPKGFCVVINHVDADVVLSVWLLRNSTRWSDPEARRKAWPLVETIAAGDAHGPAYPVLDPELADLFHGHIIDPCRHRRTGDPPAAILRMLEDCVRRMEAWWRQGLAVHDETTHAEAPPELAIEDHGSFVLAVAADPRLGRARNMPELYRRGHDRIVLASPTSHGRWKYTLARRTDFVDAFDLPRLYRALNVAEHWERAGVPDDHGTWGGSSTIGGGPRAGSVLPPDRVVEIVAQTFDARNS